MILCRRYHFELQFKPMWLFQTSIVFLWMSKNSHLSDVFDRFWIIKRFYQGTIIVPWFYLALNSIENNFCKCLWTKLSTNLKYKLSSHKNLSDVPIEHKYFFIKGKIRCISLMKGVLFCEKGLLSLKKYIEF